MFSNAARYVGIRISIGSAIGIVLLIPEVVK
jgi:hypothetical protein